MLTVLTVFSFQMAVAQPAIAPASDSLRPAKELEIAGQRYSPVVRGCYEREGLRRDPALTGTMDVGVVIEPHGVVRRVRIDTAGVRGVGMREVADCVARSAASWRFSAGRFAVEETIFTFKLLPSDGAKTTGPSGPSGDAYSYRSDGSAAASSMKYVERRSITSER